MAYIPDELVLGNLQIAPSAVRLLFYYCGRANQDTGETNVSPQRASQDLGIRKDHVDEHDRKLVREGFITIAKAENGGRVVRMLSPWQPRAERNGQPTQKPKKKATSQDLGKPKKVETQKLGSPLNGSPSSGEVPQVLGESPQSLGDIAQNLGKSPQVLGVHIGITSSWNQLMEPAQEPTLGADAPTEISKSRAVELFEEHRKSIGKYEAPYHWKDGDFVQWEALLKRCRKPKPPKSAWTLTEGRFLQALTQYLATPQLSHTFADLCSRFADFFRAAGDRFNKPVTAEGEQDGKTANSEGDARRERWEQAADRIKAGEVI